MGYGASVRTVPLISLILEDITPHFRAMSSVMSWEKIKDLSLRSLAIIHYLTNVYPDTSK